ncbi:MAG: hypothetical protein IPL09_12515 [Bacteroidetes bacterium]|nr:hypothetical protein [Bacteroidota bacterium]MBK7040077.1 hypothetical protein [Bacteroidota bacterium]MBK8330263.1 hypothetical protein [Bacteroidota bacterium]MBK9299891.1 hypothetical protein [Bacteroidota bacterium]
MKKIIIVPLILLVTGSIYAQEKVIFNANGTAINSTKVQIVTSEKPTEVVESNFNADGTSKSNYVSPIQSESGKQLNTDNLIQFNENGTVGKEPTMIAPKTQVVKVESTEDDLSYRTNGNATKRDLIGKNEDPLRNTNPRDLIGKNEDPLRNTNPRDLIGKNENAPRKGGLQTNNQNPETSQVTNRVSNVPQSSTPTVNSKGNVISEADQKLSDMELNKKYPNRNGSYTKPVTGNNTTVSDKEKSNQPLNAPQYFKNIEKNDPKSDALKTNK